MIPKVVDNIKSAAAARGAKMISCDITMNVYDSMTTEVVTQVEVDPGTEKAREELEEKIKERKEKIDELIEKKKAMIADGTAKTAAEEYEEYKTAYDAYHSENGSSLIEKITGDTKKAYDIYKNIIDGTKISMNDEKFLIFHNWTMYRAAKDECIRKTDELYNTMKGIPLK